MNACAQCLHRSTQGSTNPHAWLCQVFERNEMDQVTGDMKPPLHYCYRVREISAVRETCKFFEPRPVDQKEQHK